MAKQRASVQKRQREHLKRQREFKKAEKAALKRERKLHPELFASDNDEQNPNAPSEGVDGTGEGGQPAPPNTQAAPGSDSESTKPAE